MSATLPQHGRIQTQQEHDTKAAGSGAHSCCVVSVTPPVQLPRNLSPCMDSELQAGYAGIKAPPPLGLSHEPLLLLLAWLQVWLTRVDPAGGTTRLAVHEQCVYGSVLPGSQQTPACKLDQGSGILAMLAR
jgi:hypothetical protein